jgi:N-acylglucosamine 2-epimerase
VRPGGAEAEGDLGQTFIPGHAIECMWFMERIYAYHRRPERVRQALEAIRWHLERGWDEEFGGIYLACHAAGGKPVWHAPEAKLWWPATEALYALLRAYELSGEAWCMEWYWRVHDYTFSHYPNREHGDWYQYLDREGRPTVNLIPGLGVKDPFHLPRALIYSIKTLRNLAGR